MGEEPIPFLHFDGRIPENGASGSIKMVSGTIPIFRALHPMLLVEQPSLKREAFQQLQKFHKILLQMRIVPRENLARYNRG